MDPEVEQPVPRTRSEVGAPPHGSGLTRDDYLVIYGPLGIGWLILLGMMGFLWRDRNGQRSEFLAETKRSDESAREEAEAQRLATAAELARRDAVHAEELERRDKERERTERLCKEERSEARAAMVTLTKEQDETMKQLDDRWRDVVRELRAALESAARKISRRE